MSVQVVANDEQNIRFRLGGRNSDNEREQTKGSCKDSFHDLFFLFEIVVANAPRDSPHFERHRYDVVCKTGVSLVAFTSPLFGSIRSDGG
jgi:hypothetical protein